METRRRQPGRDEGEDRVTETFLTAPVMTSRSEDGDDGRADSKKKAFRFRPSCDVVLLREAIKQFPWGAGYGNTKDAWTKVAKTVEKELHLMLQSTEEVSLDHAIVKRRIEVLLDAYRKNDMSALRGAGSPGELAQRNQSLGMLKDMLDNHGKHKSKRAVDSTKTEQVRHIIKQYPTNTSELPRGDVEVVPPSTKKMKKSQSAKELCATVTSASSSSNGSVMNKQLPQTLNVASGEKNGTKDVAITNNHRSLLPSNIQNLTFTEFLEQKNADRRRDLEFRERELQLAERRLLLDEKKFDLETQREQQFAQERQMHLEAMKAQSRIMLDLLELLRNKKASTL